MPDAPETPATTPEPSTPSTPLDVIREGLEEDTPLGNAAPEGGAEGAEGAAAEGGQAEGAPAAQAEASPLTDEQIASLVGDPRVREAVLSSDEGQSVLDKLFSEVLSERESKATTEKVQKEAAATLEEAMKLAADGDASSLGELIFNRLQEEAVAEKYASQYIEPAKAQVIEDMDTAIADVYGDIIETLTPEELDTLDRRNFNSDAQFVAGVLRTLDNKRSEGVRSEQSGALSAAEQAAQIATAGAKAREAVGVGALTGGSGVESGGDSNLGSLIREGLRSALADAEE